MWDAASVWYVEGDERNVDDDESSYAGADTDADADEMRKNVCMWITTDAEDREP